MGTSAELGTNFPEDGSGESDHPTYSRRTTPPNGAGAKKVGRFASKKIRAKATWRRQVRRQGRQVRRQVRSQIVGSGTLRMLISRSCDLDLNTLL